MKKLLGGSALIVAAAIPAYGAWAYWDVLTQTATLFAGAAIGACLAAGLLVLLWRPAHPATRYHSTLPSPWDRKRWR